MNKATERPWKLWKENKDCFIANGLLLGEVMHNLNTRSPVDYLEMPDEEQCHKNAELIVRAVNRDHLFDELVEALKTSQALFKTQGESSKCIHTRIGAREMEERLEAVLNKVREGA